MKNLKLQFLQFLISRDVHDLIVFFFYWNKIYIYVNFEKRVFLSFNFFFKEI